MLLLFTSPCISTHQYVSVLKFYGMLTILRTFLAWCWGTSRRIIRMPGSKLEPTQRMDVTWRRIYVRQEDWNVCAVYSLRGNMRACTNDVVKTPACIEEACYDITSILKGRGSLFVYTQQQPRKVAKQNSFGGYHFFSTVEYEKVGGGLLYHSVRGKGTPVAFW